MTGQNCLHIMSFCVLASMCHLNTKLKAERKREKTTPFGVLSTRSLVTYQAAQKQKADVEVQTCSASGFPVCRAIRTLRPLNMTAL